MMTMAGWTIEEWAIAAARMPGYPPTFDGSRQLRDAWGHRPKPGEIKLIDVSYPSDYEWASGAFKDAMSKNIRIGY